MKKLRPVTQALLMLGVIYVMMGIFYAAFLAGVIE